jgi:phage terminase large subunit GpA-like protein
MTFLRVVRGTPDEAELAALTAVVAGLAAADRRPAEPEHRSAWADHRRMLRGQTSHGPGAWRVSGLPW